MNLSFLKKPVPWWARLGVFIVALWYFGFLIPILQGDILIHTQMPGNRYSGFTTPLTVEELQIKDVLYQDVEMLSEKIGERNMWHYAALQKSATYIKKRFTSCGYKVKTQQYSVKGKTVENITAELKGSTNNILVVGAHYDSVTGTKGANDNATGVAAMLTALV